MLKKLFPREEIGIDLGTANTLIYKKGTGIVLNEPTMITIHRAENRVIAIGKESADMMGKAADPIEIIRPMRDGVIDQYKLTGIMLKGFIQAVIGRRARPQTIIISIPVGCTDIETMAVKRTLEEIAPNKVHLISQPLAAALGGGLNIKQPVGRMIIDVGGGTTQIAIISALGVVIAKTIKVGGDALTDAIARFVKDTHKVAIGEKIAEEIKFNIGNVHKDIELENYQVHGLDLTTGKPIVFELSAEGIRDSLEPIIGLILRSVCDVVQNSPSEVVRDLIVHGIYLTGGGALLKGLATRIAEETELAVQILEAPLNVVALGTGVIMDHLSDYEHLLYKAINKI